MKNVVIISYHFPPSGGKAVQRASKLAKYLPEFGWRPVVFTMPTGERGVPEDVTLTAELPSNLEIHRPRARDWWKLVPYDIRKHVHHPLPDKYRAWANCATAPLVRYIETHRPDALISTSPSHSVQLMGLTAKRRTGIPWIADFRDPWTGHENFQGRYGTHIMMRDETAVISEADAVVGVYPKILRGFAGRTDDAKMHQIENGYDESDFHLVDRTLPASEGPLKIGYNGTVSRFHDPKPLIASLKDLLRRGAVGPADIRCVFTTNKSGRKWFAPYRDLIDAGLLEIRDYQPHSLSLASLAELDVSTVILTHGRDIFPAKVFEYFYIGNPVLAITAHDDDLANLVRDAAGGVVADANDPDGVGQALMDLIAQKKNGSLPHFATHHDNISKYSRRNIAGRYAALLDSICND